MSSVGSGSPRTIWPDRSRRDLVDYAEWARDGFLKLTPGNVMDYRTIRENILEVAERFDLRSIGYRRFGAQQLAPELMEEGLDLAPIASTPAQMSESTRGHRLLGLLRAWPGGRVRVIFIASDNHGGGRLRSIWPVARVRALSPSQRRR